MRNINNPFMENGFVQTLLLISTFKKNINSDVTT